MRVLLLALIALTQTCSPFQINPAYTRTCCIIPTKINNQQDQFQGTKPLHKVKSSTALFMAPARDANPRVIYQKVIRSPPDAQFFLPSLIDYIQTEFELPKDLPMVYTPTIPNDDDGDDNDDDDESPSNDQGYAILELDSPLSRNKDATRMEVEVVGIYTEDDNISGAKLPSMAMVVIKKMSLKDQQGDIMMKRMFDDSEAKIVKALDMGLDDFVDGKVRVKAGKSKGTNAAFREKEPEIEMDKDGEWSALDSLDDYEGFEEVDGTMEDLMVASTGKNIGFDNDVLKSNNKSGNGNDGIIDAVLTGVAETKKAANGIPKVTNERSTSRSLNTNPEPVQDFAVQAAIAAAAKKKLGMKEDVSIGEDFAVQAARAAAKNLTSKPKVEKKDGVKVTQKTIADIEQPAPAMSQEVAIGGVMPMELPTVGVSPMLQNLSKKGSNSFQVKISDSKSFAKRDKVFENTVAAKVRSSRGKQVQRNVNIVTDTSVDATSLSEEERQQSLDELRFKKVTQSSDPTIVNGQITKTDQEIEQDVLNAAMDIMPGQTSAESSEDDMSAEELLKSILKFGDEKEKEEAGGSGFAKGAFAKAKELTEEKKMYREISKTQSLAEEIKYADDDSKETLSAEEELKRIFAAGEKIAESRMTPAKAMQDRSPASPQKVEKSIVNDQYVDELIEKDKTVPGNARTLDDELAELEVRISKSPGEDTEAYGPNAVFDVFSGPEVYNPNVDPLKSVNWPGALPETRTDIRLPPELEEAVKSAKFAAKLLSRMVVEEEEKKVFYIDGKEISDDQVQRLRQAVDDGVTVGLIDDPMKYMKERSRLEMLVNELVNQPEERFGEIATFYKDLLLSDNFVTLLKDNLRAMASKHLEMKRSDEDPTKLESQFTRERDVLGKLVKYSQLLLKEVQALGAELESSQLEVIRSICNVAMDPDHTTEEETAAALSDAVRDMKPLLDEGFVAYLKYAIAEEEGRLARAGLLDDPEHNRWLFVLQIVQEGVYAELGVGVQRYIDHINYVLRMDTKKERRQLLSKLIEVMPSMVSTFISCVTTKVTISHIYAFLPYFNNKS